MKTGSKVFTLLPFFQIEGINATRVADLLDTNWESDEEIIKFNRELEFEYELDGPSGDKEYKRTKELSRSHYDYFWKKSAGRFFKARPCLAGKLEYEEIIDDGSTVIRSVSIFAILEFRRQGFGAGAPPSNEYHVKLDSEGVNYTRNLQLSHALKPGDIDRFLIEVAADKSSIHELIFSLRFNNDNLVEAPVKLEIFCTPQDSYGAQSKAFIQQK